MRVKKIARFWNYVKSMKFLLSLVAMLMSHLI